MSIIAVIGQYATGSLVTLLAATKGHKAEPVDAPLPACAWCGYRVQHPCQSKEHRANCENA